eukprot:jgi/Chrzof1/337/Cz01g12030.t1
MASTSSRVLIGKGLVQSPGPSKLQLLQLPSPSTGHAQQCILTDTCLLELNRIKQQFSSWFVGDCIISGHEAGLYCDIATLLSCEQWPAAAQLAELAESHLPLICDVKDCDGDKYYKLNERKCLAWLRCKVHKAQSAFDHAAQSSVAGMTEANKLSYTIGFIGEYLNTKWQAQLAENFGAQPAGLAGSVLTTRPSNQEPCDAADKKPKLDPKEAARKKAEEGRAEARAAKLAKEAAGTKKISNFFARKAAP